jgi:acetyltransferase
VTQRNLQFAFRPDSIAVIGASEREGSVGRVVMENIRAAGYAGAVYPVNPKHDQVLGRRCYGRVADLPAAPDLTVIVTPAVTVPGLIAEIGAAGGKAAVVISSGISRANGLAQQMLDAAKPHLLRIIGPNTIGILAPPLALNASFTCSAPARGRLALISQSGAMVSSLVDWAVEEGIGFSHIVSLGDMADVDVGDCLNYFAADRETSAVLMYLESLPNPRKFMSAARAAARVKPVIALKPGRHPAAQKAAQTHTGALAGADRVIDAALRRAGIIRVDHLEDLFIAAEVTGRYRPLARARVGIVTNGGGAGVLMVDHLLDAGCEVAQLAQETLASLDAVLPQTWSRANPVDIIGDAPPERFGAAVTTVAKDPGVDCLMVLDCPTALASPRNAAATVAALASGGYLNGKPVLTCWLGKHEAEKARAVLEAAGIANLDTPHQAARAIAMLTQWSALRASLEQVAPRNLERPTDIGSARAIIQKAAAEHRPLLTEPEAKGVLAALGIPVPQTLTAASPEEVGRVAERLLGSAEAVVVKLLSRTITHKSDTGGVVLNLRTPKAASAAAGEILERLAAAGREGELDGFTIQPMVVRPKAHELIAGISTDAAFGPTLLFGAGGTSVEVVNDTATAILPIARAGALDLIGRTRVAKLLAGYRDRPPADHEAIVDVLTALSQLVTDIPAISAIDINPLIAGADGVIALDARVEIEPGRVDVPAPNPRLAIRPYPSDAATHASLSGREFLIRAIRPEDAALYPEFLAHMDPEDMRLRFLVPLRNIPHDLLVRLTQLDYDRDIAFVAVEEASGALCGIVRYSALPDRESADFGVLVRSDLNGHGLGRTLMTTLIDYARREGIGRLDGDVLRENKRMLQLCEDLGFGLTGCAEEPSRVRATLSLR